MRSLLCYKFQCRSCNANDYGKTKGYFKVRASECMGVCTRTGKNIISTKDSALRDHKLICDTTLSFEDFSALANGTKCFRIKLPESLLIHRNEPRLNKAFESVPLMLFP